MPATFEHKYKLVLFKYTHTPGDNRPFPDPPHMNWRMIFTTDEAASKFETELSNLIERFK